MFQEFEAPRFQENRHVKVVRLSVLRGESDSINFKFFKGADKSLARPISRCILFDGGEYFV